MVASRAGNQPRIITLGEGYPSDPKYVRTPLGDYAIPANLTEEEFRFFYEHPETGQLFLPAYKAYNRGLIDNIIKNTRAQTDYNLFRDTGRTERFMLNSFQFSAAKSATEARLIQSQVFDENGKRKSFSEFRRNAKEIGDTMHDFYWRVEYDNSLRSTVQAEEFMRMQDDSDLYPYWRWHGRLDSRERLEHVEMEGKTFRIGDVDGDACFPPGDWNCIKGHEVVLTPAGWQRIDVLNVGDTVIGGSGNERKIRFKHINKFDGKMVDVILKNNSVSYTDNHRILTIKGWVESGSIKAGNISINKAKRGFFNNIVSYINNCYAFACYIVMSLVIKRKPTFFKAFNTNLQFRYININPVRGAIEIMKWVKSCAFNIFNHNTFAWGGCSSCHNVPFGVNGINSFLRIGIFSPNIWSPSGCRNFKFFGNMRKFFTQIRMRRLRNILSHVVASLLFPFICIYPLGLYCIAAVSDWYIEMIEQSRDNPVIAYFPALAKFSERIKLNRVKFVQNNGDGAPLDSFNSRYVFLYNMFFHFKMNLIVDVKLSNYIDNVYNLDVEIDSSYITKTGIAHNCRCAGVAMDENDVKRGGYTISSNAEARKLLETHINEQFRYNPAVQGMMPKTGNYFEAMPFANNGNARTFGLERGGSDKQLTGLRAKGLHNLLEVVNDWRKEYHTNNKGDVVFQNAASLSNIRLTPRSIHVISEHTVGIDNLPDCVIRADEIWQQWGDEKQMIVERAYILFGRTGYVVTTSNGIITDALAVSNGNLEKYRKGCIFIV